VRAGNARGCIASTPPIGRLAEFPRDCAFWITLTMSARRSGACLGLEQIGKSQRDRIARLAPEGKPREATRPYPLLIASVLKSFYRNIVAQLLARHVGFD
jgi:hypothetical protein